MKVDRMANEVRLIDMRADCMTNEFREFRLDTMQAFRLMQDSMQEAFKFMRKQHYLVHHDTRMHDATEDVAMRDEGGTPNLNMNMVDDESEVQYVTLSKVGIHTSHMTKIGNIVTMYIASSRVRDIRG
ncbi:hypothetical protein FNV43_RR09600 [Rhamnella rubrinervis]|uniref:Uncharacterized protein n=1 Tax=Rhamnella rubrinervis TaxID=2594499 RepID=A0A8K0HB05_9ROSA|nr:hypothetical protein FNV43_RR09600 [Rhamnella rubrinervis]